MDKKISGFMKDARYYKDQIDFGIITIRYDEFDAAFSGRFKIDETAIGSNGTRRYAISRVQADNGTEYLVSLTRSPDQGHGPAQAAADDMIEDLNPRWLMVIGIGGCIPSNEFSLGDVLVANVVPDFSLQAVTHNKLPSFDIRGGEVHPEVEALVAHLPAMKNVLKGWNTKRSIRSFLPDIKIPNINSDPLYGPEEWQRKIIDSLSKRFPDKGRARQPKCWTGLIGTSNTLVKDVDLIATLLHGVRGIVAVEMETGGVRRAARRANRNIPVLTIRGVSDVIGLERDSVWTDYACHSVASFTYALIRSGQVLPPKKSSPRSVKLPLRREPIEVPAEEFMEVFGLHGNKRRPNDDKYILSEYEGNDDGLTVTDHATGLMWQKSGSDSEIPYKRVQTYVEELNSEQFAGYSDWRLPTIEELISLWEPKQPKIKGYIDPIFDSTQSFCWSSDKRLPAGVYYFNFHIGGVYWLESTDNICYVRAVRSSQSLVGRNKPVRARKR